MYYLNSINKKKMEIDVVGFLCTSVRVSHTYNRVSYWHHIEVA